MIKEKDMLAGAVNYLLRNEEARHRIIDAGTEALESMRGALDVTVRGLEPFIHPLVVKARLGGAPGRRSSASGRLLPDCRPSAPAGPSAPRTVPP